MEVRCHVRSWLAESGLRECVCICYIRIIIASMIYTVHGGYIFTCSQTKLLLCKAHFQKVALTEAVSVSE